MHYLTDLWHALDFGSMGKMAMRAAAVLVCLTVHETCHALAAYALGDPTAKRQHRLSLNPLHHIDWLGLAMLMLAGFGWAKPVPVNPYFFKKPKSGMALTALAGPVSNFLLALLALVALRFFLPVLGGASLLNQFLLECAILSIDLGVFNLIPIPPLDGSKVLGALLPDRQYEMLLRYEHLGILVLWALLLVGVGGELMDGAIVSIFDLFCRIVGLF